MGRVKVLKEMLKLELSCHLVKGDVVKGDVTI